MKPTRQNELFALFSLISFSFFIMIRDYSLIQKRHLIENLITISFELLFFLPIVLLSIPCFEKKIKKSLSTDKVFNISFFIVFLSSFYYLILSFFNFTDSEKHLEEIQNIFWKNLPWQINLALCYIFLILFFRLSLFLMDQRANKKKESTFIEKLKPTYPVLIPLLLLSPLIGFVLKIKYLGLLIPLLLLGMIYISQLHYLKYSKKKLTLSDFFSLLPMIFIPLIFQKVKYIQPQIPLVLILIALFYGGGKNKIGRKAFFYHFSFNYKNFATFVCQSIIALAGIFLFSLATGFIRLENFQTKGLEPYLLFKNMNIWFYYVGISEEIIFKIILLKILADSFSYLQKPHPQILGMLSSAIIFGLAHAIKGWDYAFLAFISSCVTGFFYLRYRGIIAPIFFHMLLDIVAISLFQAKL